MEAENAWYDEGRRLRRLLRARKETLKQFSDRSTVPYRTLQNHVAGKTSPSAEQLKKFAEAGIDINFLLTGRGKFQDRSLLDENEYLLLSDKELSSAIMDAAFKAIDFYFNLVRPDRNDLTFKNLMADFLLIQDKLATNILSFHDSIFQARESGIPTDEILRPIIDLTFQVYAAELRAKANVSVTPPA